MKRRKTICVDLDGVITAYNLWKTKLYRLNDDKVKMEFFRKLPALKGAREMMRILGQRYDIIIYTARGEKLRKLTEDWLKLEGIKYNKLIMDKPMAYIYIDDRGFEFNGYEWIDCDLIEIVNKIEGTSISAPSKPIIDFKEIDKLLKEAKQ